MTGSLRTLLFGRNGQLGAALEAAFGPAYGVVAVGREEVDLTDHAALAAVLESARWDLIVNAAAYTAVDRAESEPELAAAVNAVAPGRIAEAAARSGALLVHYSTDYVFDGRAKTPYAENDPTAPLGVYGRTKLAGEDAVRATGCRHLILRTSWVFSPRGRNFLLTMLRLAAQGGPLRVVDDQTGSPTLADDLAAATVAILDRHRGGGLGGLPPGTYHATGSGHTTWCRFARRILAGAGLGAVEVRAIGTAEYPTAAPRPAYSVLSNERLRRTFGVTLPPWDDAVDRCLEAIGQR